MQDGRTNISATEITPDDPVWSFAGVRALYDDGAGAPEDVTRDYMLTLDERPVSAPLLTVFGGKITTYRRLAEAAMDRIGKFFTPRPRWTARLARCRAAILRPTASTARIAETLRRWPFLSEPHARRLTRAYGTPRRCASWAPPAPMTTSASVSPATSPPPKCAIWCEQEWAQTADDVLWRRSKLGLTASAEETAALAAFISALRQAAGAQG